MAKIFEEIKITLPRPISLILSGFFFGIGFGLSVLVINLTKVL